MKLIQFISNSVAHTNVEKRNTSYISDALVFLSYQNRNKKFILKPQRESVYA